MGGSVEEPVAVALAAVPAGIVDLAVEGDSVLAGLEEEAEEVPEPLVAVWVAVAAKLGPEYVVETERSLITDAEATSKTFASSLQHVLPSEPQQYLLSPQDIRSS